MRIPLQFKQPDHTDYCCKLPYRVSFRKHAAQHCQIVSWVDPFNLNCMWVRCFRPYASFAIGFPGAFRLPTLRNSVEARAIPSSADGQEVLSALHQVCRAAYARCRLRDSAGIFLKIHSRCQRMAQEKLCLVEGEEHRRQFSGASPRGSVALTGKALAACGKTPSWVGPGFSPDNHRQNQSAFRP
jgi:hypothetical protein